MSCNFFGSESGIQCQIGKEAAFQLHNGIASINSNHGCWSSGGERQPDSPLRLHQHRLSAQAVEFWCTLRNDSGKRLQIRRINIFDGLLQAPSAAWQVFHGELFKREEYFGGYSYFTGDTMQPLHQTSGCFGLSEDLVFPGIFFTHPDYGTVLMSVLTQERCKPAWTLKRRSGKLCLTAQESWFGIPAIPLSNGQTFSSERWVIIHTPGDIHAAMQQYHKLLARRLDFAGRHSILREAILWGSWNYNCRPRGHCDIDHAYILRNAQALQKLAAGKPAFVMIDDGYQRGCASARTTSYHGLDNFFPNPKDGYDCALFPQGMRAMASDIRKAGVRPAIWSTPIIRTDTELGRRHPEWCLRLAGGREFNRPTSWLDYSLPEVREHTRRCWQTIFQDWGYDGLKLDFWTEMFEVPYIRFQNQDKTAIELRNLFLSDIAEFVPEQGYLLTCCNTNAGNPFVGRWSHGARTSIDIGNGSWSEVMRSAQWQSVAATFYRGDAHLCDADSFGWAENISRRENETWATLALMGGSICEIGGDLTRLSPEAENLLRTGTALFAPRRKGWNSLFQGLGNLPAGHWRMESEQGDLEAWINWYSFPKALNLKRPVRNLWTGETLSGTYLLPPHASLLTRQN